MARLIPASERLQRARTLIQQAYDFPVPTDEGGRYNFSYIAQVKNFLREARDLVKFIPQTASATPEMKADVKAIFEQIERADREILHG